MLHRRNSASGNDKDAELAARSARIQVEREARRSAEKAEQQEQVAPAPSIQWGQRGVGALLADEEFGTGEESPEVRRREFEEAKAKNSSGVKTSVMMDKGKKPNAGVISLGWAPNSLSSAPSDEAERAAEPYPVSQSQGETIAVLKDALKSERRATEEAEARCKLLMSEKEALLESLRAAQDKILAYASGLSIN